MKHSHKEKRINFQVLNGKDFLFQQSKNEIDLFCHLIFASPEKKRNLWWIRNAVSYYSLLEAAVSFYLKKKKLRILVLNFTLIPLSYF